MNPEETGSPGAVSHTPLPQDWWATLKFTKANIVPLLHTCFESRRIAQESFRLMFENFLLAREADILVLDKNKSVVLDSYFGWIDNVQPTQDFSIQDGQGAIRTIALDLSTNDCVFVLLNTMIRLACWLQTVERLIICVRHKWKFSLDYLRNIAKLRFDNWDQRELARLTREGNGSW